MATSEAADEPGRPVSSFSPARILLAGLLGVVLLGALGLLLTMAANRPFQVDEVEHIHAAYELRAGRLIYRDFRQAHDPLLYPLLEPLIDPSQPAASFHRARILSTGMLLGTIVLVGLCAYRLSNWLGAWLAVGLCLTNTTLLERGMEVRPDGPVAFCTAAALAVELSGWGDRRRYVVEGLLLSSAFLFTNKAAFACFAFGCLWLVTAIRRRRPSLVVWPMAAWTLPLLGTAAVMAWLGNLGPFLRLNVLSAASEALGTAAHTTRFGPWRFLVHEGVRNGVFSVLALAGLIYGAAAWLRRSPAGSSRRGGGGLRFTLFLGVVLLASLWLNPFPFPYLHVTVLPTLAVLASVVVACGASRYGLTVARPAGLALVLVLVAASLLVTLPRLVDVASRSQTHQLDTLEEVQRVTAPGDAVFDMVGLYFRPDGHFAYLMTGNTFSRYSAGGLPPIPEELRRTGTVALIVNYRTSWMDASDRRFLAERFVHYDGNVYLLGTDLSGLGVGETRRFEALAEKRFRIEGDGTFEVDGAPFTGGILGRGWHDVRRISGGGPSRLIVATPEPVPWPPRPPAPLYVNFD